MKNKTTNANQESQPEQDTNNLIILIDTKNRKHIIPMTEGKTDISERWLTQTLGNKGLHREYIKSFTIPDCVTSIGDSAFKEFWNLRSLTFGNNVTKIGYTIFSKFNRLTAFTISNSEAQINAWAFEHCHDLKFIVAPRKLKIGDHAFGQVDAAKIIRSTPLMEDTPLSQKLYYVKKLYSCIMQTQKITDPDKLEDLKTCLRSAFFDKKRDLEPTLKLLSVLALTKNHANNTEHTTLDMLRNVKECIEQKYESCFDSSLLNKEKQEKIDQISTCFFSTSNVQKQVARSNPTRFLSFLDKNAPFLLTTKISQSIFDQPQQKKENLGGGSKAPIAS